MRNDKHLAIKLRKLGRSYHVISKELGVPKSTLSDWLGGTNWSKQIKIELTRRANYVAQKRLRLINKARRAMWERWREVAREEARKEFPRLRRNPLFIAGIMLYWGEGDSKMENGCVKIANTDPEMIRIFALFLKKICRVANEKIKMELILYPDLKEDTCKKLWSKAGQVPLEKFIKTQVIQGRHPTRRLSHGICLMYVNSRQLKEKIYTWLKLYQQVV